MCINIDGYLLEFLLLFISAWSLILIGLILSCKAKFKKGSEVSFFYEFRYLVIIGGIMLILITISYVIQVILSSL